MHTMSSGYISLSGGLSCHNGQILKRGGRPNDTSFISNLFIHSLLTINRPSPNNPLLTQDSHAVARENSWDTNNTSAHHVSPFAFIEEEGGEASTKAQLSYILMPRYFCLFMLWVRSLNRKQGALKCCSTTTGCLWKVMGCLRFL